MKPGNDLPGDIRFWMFTVFVGLLLAGLLVYLIINSREGIWSLAGMSLVFAGLQMYPSWLVFSLLFLFRSWAAGLLKVASKDGLNRLTIKRI